MNARQERVLLGYVSGLHGVRGWVKIFSYTDPPDNIFEYSPWILEQKHDEKNVALVDGRSHGAGLIAKLENCEDRDQAALLVGARVWVERERLPELSPGHYYWNDLIGLEVVTGHGDHLGVVERLFETGSNDVMVVRGDRERLVPWITDQVIAAVDLQQRRITVNWDPEF